MARKRKRGRGLKLKQDEREQIVQEYFATGNKAEVARRHKVSWATVHKVVNQAHEDPNLMAHRAKALDQLSGQAHDTASQVLGSIAPEDLESTRHRILDDNGNVKKIIEEGPSLRDKAYLFSNLVDKVDLLHSARVRVANPELALSADGGLMLPDSVDAARALLTSKVKRLRLVDVTFADDRLTKVATAAGITEQEIEDADLDPAEVLASFDN